MSFDEVRRAYRDLITVWHPDRHAHNERIQEKANDKVKQINSAYEIVKPHFEEKQKIQQNKKFEQDYRNTKKNEKTASKDDDSSVFYHCFNCGAKNRVPNNRAEDKSLKCGKCGKNFYAKTEDKTSTYGGSKSSSANDNSNRVACAFGACIGIIKSDGRCSQCNRTLEEGLRDEKIATEKEEAESLQREIEKSRQQKRNIIIGIIVVVAICYFGGSFIIDSAKDNNYVSDGSAKKVNYKPTTPSAVAKSPQPSLKKFTKPTKPLPRHGEIRKFTPEESVAPLSIKTSRGHNYLLKLVDVFSGTAVLDIFLHGGHPLEVEVPLGSYTMKWASGKDWYGYADLFGPNTSCSLAKSTFVFRVEDNRVMGYNLTLYSVSHGNLHTASLPLSQF